MAGQHHLLPHKLSPGEYRYKPENGVEGYGINTAVEYLGDNKFESNAMPIHRQKLLDNPSIDELGMTLGPRFDELANDPTPILEELITALDRYAEQWRAQISEFRKDGKDDDADASEAGSPGFYKRKR